ncbi:hypothetical protein ACTMU2_15945 [Cupriavidus basilensis]
MEKSASTAVPTNEIRAAGYGMPGVLVERNDAVAVLPGGRRGHCTAHGAAKAPR